MAEIVLFNAKDDERLILEKITSKENIAIIEIGMKDLDQKVGYLAGLDGFEKLDIQSEFEEKYDFTFMLFKDFDQKELFDFIDLMKKDRLYIPHKAAITENNIQWPLRFLLDENDEEHKTMGIINDINKLVKIAHDHKEEHGENEEIANLVKEINSYFGNPVDFSIERAYKYREDLERLVKALK